MKQTLLLAGIAKKGLDHGKSLGPAYPDDANPSLTWRCCDGCNCIVLHACIIR